MAAMSERRIERLVNPGEFCRSQKFGQKQYWSSDDNCTSEESESDSDKGGRVMLLQAEHLTDHISPQEGATISSNKRKRCRYENLLERGTKKKGRVERKRENRPHTFFLFFTTNSDKTFFFRVRTKGGC